MGQFSWKYTDMHNRSALKYMGKPIFPVQMVRSSMRVAMEATVYLEDMISMNWLQIGIRNIFQREI